MIEILQHNIIIKQFLIFLMQKLNITLRSAFYQNYRYFFMDERDICFFHKLFQLLIVSR